MNLEIDRDYARPAASNLDLLTELQAQEQELPMSLAWYRRRRRLGGGPPYIRVSNRIFYRRGDLRAWILGLRRGSSTRRAQNGRP